MARNPSLVGELCRVLDSGDRAMLSAISWGLVTVDGYTLKVSDDRRWPKDRLVGRMAKCHGRAGRLFGAGGRVEPTQVGAS